MLSMTRPAWPRRAGPRAAGSGHGARSRTPPVPGRKVASPAAGMLPGHLIATAGPAGHRAAAVMVITGLAVGISLLVKPPADLHAARWRLVIGLTLLFLLAPASRASGLFRLPAALEVMLHGQLGVLAQPGHLRPLVSARYSVATAAAGAGVDPVAQGARVDPQIPGHLRDRIASLADQRNGALPETGVELPACHRHRLIRGLCADEPRRAKRVPGGCGRAKHQDDKCACRECQPCGIAGGGEAVVQPPVQAHGKDRADHRRAQRMAGLPGS